MNVKASQNIRITSFALKDGLRPALSGKTKKIQVDLAVLVTFLNFTEKRCLSVECTNLADNDAETFAVAFRLLDRYSIDRPYRDYFWSYWTNHAGSVLVGVIFRKKLSFGRVRQRQ